jgi:hypothetical protein
MKNKKGYLDLFGIGKGKQRQFNNAKIGRKKINTVRRTEEKKSGTSRYTK